MVEIGAGSGVITSALAKRCREVWAYEPDPVQVKVLRENLKRENITNVKIIEKDFLKAAALFQIIWKPATVHNLLNIMMQ